jgi:subtilisin family serine protease
MRIRGNTQLRHYAGALAGTGVALFGCAQATQTGKAPTASISAAGSFFGTVNTTGSRALSVVESRTLSFALDRIDQRRLPLDRTYRHGGTGKGITIYVFDGGVSADHPELAGRVRRGYTAFPIDPAICNAHGTAVAGAIAGATLGVAPDAEIVDVKMVECGRLRGTIQGIVDGAKWVIEDVKKHPDHRAVANWSFIADTSAVIPALDSAVASLLRASIPVIVSAGNLETNACRVSPANSPGTIVVGSSSLYTDPTTAMPADRRAPGTAYGPCIDLYAPGDSVLLPSLDQDQKATTQLWNGTSMSAGYVSGAVALFLEANPTATPQQVLQHLKSTATANVVRSSRSQTNFMLYVGPVREPEPITRVSAAK